MHLKIFSLLTVGGKVALAPAYDFINSTIALGNAREELALPLNGKKRNLKYKDFLEYYAVEKLKLNKVVIDQVLEKLAVGMVGWPSLIDVCFLSDELKDDYRAIIAERSEVLRLV